MKTMIEVEAIKERHSVRDYKPQRIEEEIETKIRKENKMDINEDQKNEKIGWASKQ